MILPGKAAHLRGILTNLRCATTQVQPCGIDLSLKHVMRLDSAGAVDFDNRHRKTASASVLAFDEGSAPNAEDQSLHLEMGVYLVEFNELIDCPLDVMGQIFVRSTLFRSGAQIHAGVMDSGYKGVIGAMLRVENASGLRVFKDARLAQMVFHQLTEATTAYEGHFQGRKGM